MGLGCGTLLDMAVIHWSWAVVSFHLISVHPFVPVNVAEAGGCAEYC